MDPRIVSLLGYLGTVAAAVLAAALMMSGHAMAEGTAARGQVHAMTAEDGGTGAIARVALLEPATTIAGTAQR